MISRLGKKVLSVAAFIGVVLIVLIIYLYRPHKEVKYEKAAFTVTANELIYEFSKNETDATTKYLDKIIAVSGTITETDEQLFVVEEKVIAQFDDPIDHKATKLNFKGRFVGYDELLEEIRFDKCVLIE